MISPLMNGSEFNKFFPGPFYKVLADDLQHYDFKYQVGLNIDHIKFNPRESCMPGGLYFTDELNLAKYLSFGSKLGLVMIPENAQVYVELYKSKADQLILSNIIKISESKLWADPVWCAQAVKQNYHAFHYVQNSTYEMCVDVVKQRGIMLRYVPQEHKNFELCYIAVAHNGLALEYVPREHKNMELCSKAVEENGMALPFVPEKNRTINICLDAVMGDPCALQFIKNWQQTHEICMTAVMYNGLMLQFVTQQTHTICRAAINANPRAILYVKDRGFRRQLKTWNNSGLSIIL